MLFKEKELNHIRYQFEHIPTESDTYSYFDVCTALSELTEMLQQRDVVELVEGRKIIVGDIKIQVLQRTYNDLHNVIVRKPEFKKRLESIGIIEPAKDSLNFKYYLQCVYFFYILIYFVFPKEKFMDLFLEKNWCAENISESDMGTEIYEQFILNNIYHNKEYERIYKQRMQEYDNEWSLAQDSFFKFYELQYYVFLKEYFQDEKIGMVYSKELMDMYNSIISDILNSMEICMELKERNVFDSFIDFLTYYHSTALTRDMKMNLESIDFNALEDLFYDINEGVNCLEYVPIEKEEIDDLLQDESFICLCMHAKKISKTIQAKYDSFHVEEVILKTWDYEQFQMEQYPVGDGFTFLQKEEDYFMDIRDIYLLAMMRIYLPVSITYQSKRLHLNNRSNASKKDTHSIKYSYSNKKVKEMDSANSAVRDDYFRICCRFMQSMIQYQNPDDFIYFELPMNIKIFDMMEKADSYTQLEQRTEFFRMINEKLK